MDSVLADIPVQISGPVPWEAIARLLTAALLGGLIGAERERHGRSAGFRTQLLVALGAALAMLVSLHFGDVYGRGEHPSLSIDPARIAYGIMGGIGFLGAGVIIRAGGAIRGVTTAASLWCTAAVGLACGFGLYVLAVAATVLVIFALTVLNRLDKLIPSRWTKVIHVDLPCDGTANSQMLQEMLQRRGARVVSRDYMFDAARNIERHSMRLSISPGVTWESLLEIRRELPQATRIIIAEAFQEGPSGL